MKMQIFKNIATSDQLILNTVFLVLGLGLEWLMANKLNDWSKVIWSGSRPSDVGLLAVTANNIITINKVGLELALLKWNLFN